MTRCTLGFGFVYNFKKETDTNISERTEEFNCGTIQKNKRIKHNYKTKKGRMMKKCKNHPLLLNLHITSQKVYCATCHRYFSLPRHRVYISPD